LRVNRQGATRIVFLTRRWAIKVPNVLDGYKLFLCGLLANLQESRMWQNFPKPELCPVRFHLPLGLLVVMPRLDVLTDTEYANLDYESFRDRGEYSLPVEDKPNSFGWMNGQPVVIDYGN
jgi:hypothetical protein